VTKDCELKYKKHPEKFDLLLSANIWTLLHLLRTHLLLALCYDFHFNLLMSHQYLSFSLFFYLHIRLVSNIATFHFVIGGLLLPSKLSVAAELSVMFVNGQYYCCILKVENFIPGSQGSFSIRC
jgi:hypothetical protein